MFFACDNHAFRQKKIQIEKEFLRKNLNTSFLAVISNKVFPVKSNQTGREMQAAESVHIELFLKQCEIVFLSNTILLFIHDFICVELHL